LEKKLGLGAPDPDEGDPSEFHEVALAELVETERDLRQISEGWARLNDHWRRAYEELLPLFEETEALAAAVGPGGMIRQRRLSEGAEIQLEKLQEQMRAERGAEFDAAKAERRARRAPWPAPFQPWPAGSAPESEGQA
jgi:hypothetical protein